MADECTPYVPANPGDLITAENWNDMQCQVQEDIKTTAAVTKEELKEEGVSKADNAAKFDGKSPKDWTDTLDERYAEKVHDHEGMANYRRFIKRFTPELDKVLLHHDLGRFPLVDIYRLEPVVGEKASDNIREQFGHCKLLFYYGHADADNFGLSNQVYREKIRLGLPFGPLLDELGVEYEDDDTIEDVLNDMWDAFMQDPNDELDHCQSPWVEECCGKRRTVADLKKADQWNDLYVAILPLRVLAGDSVCRRDSEGQAGNDLPRPCKVVVAQANYKTIYLEVEGLDSNVDANGNVQPLDLMILMRS
jgi:hypothetical protein